MIVAESEAIMPKTICRSKEEVQEIVDRFRKSELTQREFARREGIGVSTLGFWVRGNGTASRTAVVEVSRREPAGEFVVEISGYLIHVPRDVTAEEWQRFREAWVS